MTRNKVWSIVGKPIHVHQGLEDVHNWVYARVMSMLATDLRKNLFQVLEKVSQGATVEILYKGTPMRITMTEPSSRLSRLVARDLGVVIEAGDSGWNSAEWEEEVETLLPKRRRR